MQNLDDIKLKNTLIKKSLNLSLKIKTINN